MCAFAAVLPLLELIGEKDVALFDAYDEVEDDFCEDCGELLDEDGLCPICDDPDDLSDLEEDLDDDDEDFYDDDLDDLADDLGSYDDGEDSGY